MDIINETIKAIDEESDIAPLNIEIDSLLSKLDQRIVDEYYLNEDLYNDFGDINLVSKLNNKQSIYLYRDKEQDERISVSVGAAGARGWFETEEEVADFINKEMDKHYKELEELNNL